MPKFVTIAYGDEADYQRTPEPLRAVVHQRDAYLIQRGAGVGIAGAPVQVRNTGTRASALHVEPSLHSPRSPNARASR